MPRIVRRALHVALAGALSTLALAGVVGAGSAVTASESRRTPAPNENNLPASHASSANGRFVVAVVLGQSGTVASDALAPYEVFATSSEFLVYTVAAQGGPVALDGGPALVPTYTFEQVSSGAVPRPDVVVVPAVGDPEGQAESALRTFVIGQSERGARILGVCSGSRVLAASGLLDGRRATSHWSRIGALEKARPQVNWVRGQRFVQDGTVTTTAGVTSGIPGALQVMYDLAGQSEAERVGRAVNFPDWSMNGPTAIPGQEFSFADTPVGLNAVMPWFRPTVAIGLSDGDSEISIAGAFEVYNVSYAARAIAVAAGETVTTSHGLVLITTPTAAVGKVDRVIVPGAAADSTIDPQLRTWASDHALTINVLPRAEGQNGFDAALEHLAAVADQATARSAAKMIDYPSEQLALAENGMTWRAQVLSLAAAVLAVAIGLLPTFIRRTFRRLRSRS